ncbi:response regulator [Haliangium sp.]|uniref:response regulator n=1 Tax=Haliangium sp. TaxID=2663208 RepID=UPI003D14DB5A
MRPTGRILIVDDDELFLDTYRDLLTGEGYEVEEARSQQEAHQRLDDGDWDVVLLDQKLLGPSGPDVGLELIDQVSARAPGAKCIIVTAYASKQSIERAFEAGVYEFLEKSGAFRHLLLAKIRNALEPIRSDAFGSLDDRTREAQIAERWRSLDAESDPNRKGLLLEELAELLFRSVGFRVVDRRRKSRDEEIDLVIRNDLAEPFWMKMSSYLLVECKNWSSSVDRKELDAFRSKLERRYGLAKLGFFIAPGGFTEGFRTALDAERKGEVLIVCIGPDDLRALVEAQERNSLLKKLCDQAIVAANGTSL